MRIVTRSKTFDAPPERVFTTLDDLGVTGGHMTGSSAMMMGSFLTLTYLSPNKTGLNCKYRWQGKMMGLPMDFTVLVTKWISPTEKTWETIGESKLILYSSYKMQLHLSPQVRGTDATLSIGYNRPKNFLLKLLSYLLADVYCVWCLRKMLGDAEKSISMAAMQ